MEVQVQNARIASLPKKVFDVLAAELKSRGVVDVCENQSYTEILSRAHSSSCCGESEVSQLLSRVHSFVGGDGVEVMCEEFDKLGPVNSLEALIDLFKLLRDDLVKQTSDNLNVGSVRTVVQDYLQKLMPNARAHHIAKLEHTHRVEEILNNLIQDGFCSHLDCKILITAVEQFLQVSKGTEHATKLTHLQHLLKSFQDKHERFCQEITLGALQDTLANNPALKPNKSIGTPFLVFELSYPWLNLRYHTALSALTSILPLVSQLQLQAVEGTSSTISLVFCGFEAPLISLINDLQNSEVMEGLRELKIVAKMESAEQPILAKQLPTDTTDDSSETPETDHTDQDNEQRKQKELLLYENDYLQDSFETTVMSNLLDLKELMSLIGKTNDQVEEERHSFKKETEYARTKHEDEVATIRKDLEVSNDEVSKLHKEIASLKQALRTQEAKQEKEALEKEATSLHDLLKQELDRMHEDRIKMKEEADATHKQLMDENSFLRERLAQLSQHIEDLTRQHAESSLRNDRLKEKLLKKKTLIEQFSGGYSKLADQLKEISETNARKVQEKDIEIARLQMQATSLCELHKQELDRLHQDGIKAKEEADVTHEQLKRTLIEQFSGGYSKLADQLKVISETNARMVQEVQEKDFEIARLQMQLRLQQEDAPQPEQQQPQPEQQQQALRAPEEEDQSSHDSTTTLSPSESPDLSPSVSPEGSLSNDVYVEAQTARQN